MKVMLDTNIIISIVVLDSKLLKDLLLKVCDNYELVLSSVIIDELYEVVEKKFPSKTTFVNIFLKELNYVYFEMNKKDYYNTKIYMRDKNDIPILQSVLLSQTDIFITGDKDFFDLTLEKPVIISPSDFMKLY